MPCECVLMCYRHDLHLKCYRIVPENKNADIVLFLQVSVNAKYLLCTCNRIHAMLTLSFLSKHASNMTQKLYMIAACGWQHNPVTNCVLYLKNP